MDNYKLVETFSEFKEFKNIDREAMMRIIEDVFRGMSSTESTSAPTPAPAEGEAPAATNPNPASATPEGGGTA